MGYFYEVRAESNDMNFIMMREDNGEAKYVDFYFGKPNGEEFFKRAYRYCDSKVIAIPHEIESGIAIMKLKNAYEYRLKDYLDAMCDEKNDFDDYAPLITVTIGGGRKPSFTKVFSVECAAQSNALEDAFDTLIEGFYEDM